MEIPGTVSQILTTKGTAVFTTTPEASVFDALTLMGEKNIGALVVMEGDSVAGIFSERDYSRKVILQGKTSRNTQVGEILSRPAICIAPDDGIEECMKRMTLNRIRHLPVVDGGGAMLGMISIGDLVRAVMEEQEELIVQLEKFISG